MSDSELTTPEGCYSHLSIKIVSYAVVYYGEATTSVAKVRAAGNCCKFERKSGAHCSSLRPYQIAHWKLRLHCYGALEIGIFQLTRMKLTAVGVQYWPCHRPRERTTRNRVDTISISNPPSDRRRRDNVPINHLRHHIGGRITDTTHNRGDLRNPNNRDVCRHAIINGPDRSLGRRQQ